MGMGRVKCTDSEITLSTNNSTMPGMAARKVIRKKSARVIKEPYLNVSTGSKYRSDGAQGVSGLPHWIFNMPKISQTWVHLVD